MAEDQINLIPGGSDANLEFGAEEQLGSPKKLAHPVAVVFHLAFKIAALVSYLLCSFVSDSFVLNFVLLIILLAMDFWTTKNVSGRLLVGLRWWNYIDDEGKSHWMYESKQGKERESINASESRIFWVSMFITQLLWILYIFVNIFRFNIKWLVVVIIANLLNGANLYGYIKCRIGAGKSLKDYATGMVSRKLLTGALSTLTKSGSQGNSSSQSQVV